MGLIGNLVITPVEEGRLWVLGARVRHLAHGKGHEEGGSTYTKVGSILRISTALKGIRFSSMLGCHSNFHGVNRNHEPLTLPSKVVRGESPLYENKNIGYAIVLYMCIYIMK